MRTTSLCSIALAVVVGGSVGALFATSGGETASAKAQRQDVTGTYTNAVLTVLGEPREADGWLFASMNLTADFELDGIGVGELVFLHTAKVDLGFTTGSIHGSATWTFADARECEGPLHGKLSLDGDVYAFHGKGVFQCDDGTKLSVTLDDAEVNNPPELGNNGVIEGQLLTP